MSKAREGLPQGAMARLPWGPICLWGAAGVLSIFVHAATVAWALREPPVEMADTAPPPAIMIEFAAEPEAVNTEMNEISEQVQDSLEQKSDVTEPVEEPQEPVEEPEVAEAEPEPLEPQPQPEETDPVQEEVLVALDKVEVPIPLLRPPPPVAEKPKPKKQEAAPKPKPKQEKPAPASTASRAAAAQVAQSSRNAASQTVAGMGFGSVSPARWQSRLMAHLERRKRYPSGARSRREEGIAYVRFRIDDGGNVLSASLARSSGFPELDNEVVDMVRRASPVPAPPPGVNKTITAPVKFTVR